MAIAKVILYTSKNLKDDKHPVVLRVTHKQERKYYTIGNSKSYACTEDQWNTEKYYTNKFPDYKNKNAVIQNELQRAQNIITRYEFDGVEFSFSMFERDYVKKASKNLVSDYFEIVIDLLKKSGRIGYSNAFKYTKSAVFRFSKEDLKFSEINYSYLADLESKLRQDDVKPNSVYMYFRTLRTLFNIAIKDQMIKAEIYPFSSRLNPNGYDIEHLKTDTIKRAITDGELIKFINYPVKSGTSQFHAKNYFLFSFYSMGMSFVDMSNLRWQDIQNGTFKYTRQKTGGLVVVKIQPESQRILDYYKKHYNSEFVFPILNENLKTPEEKHKCAKAVLDLTDKALRKISKKMNISNITTYTARHSWGTIMLHNGGEMSVIKQGYGHKTEEETAIYLKQFSNSVVDEANAVMLKKLANKIKSKTPNSKKNGKL